MSKTTRYVLHGALGAAAQVQGVADRLGARVIELPGHGTTPLGDTDFSMPAFVAYANRILPDDGQADLFGYSMGGYVALLLALHAPQRVRRVMTLGTKFEWTPEIAAKDAGRLNPDVIATRVPAFAEQLKSRHTADGWRANLANTAGLLRELGAHPMLTEAELGKIAQRVCVAVGDRDTTVSVDECVRIAALMPSARVDVLKETPHPFEQVDQVMLADRAAAFFAEPDV